MATGFAFQNAAPKTTSGITIEGKVIQAPEGQPIRKANVQFSACGGQSNGPYSATTDVEGRFTIDDLKPGRYMSLSSILDLFNRAASDVQYLFRCCRPGHTDVVFHMQPAATITGKIVDVDGDPMSNVGVTAIGSAHHREEGVSLTGAVEPRTTLASFVSLICAQGDIRLALVHQESRHHIRRKKTTLRSR